MDIYTAHKKRDFIRPNYFSVQCTFFNISVTWKGGKWCHFSITNLFNLQWSDFWQAGKHEEDTKYKQHKMDLQIKSHYFCHCPYHNKNLSKVSLWHFHIPTMHTNQPNVMHLLQSPIMADAKHNFFLFISVH